jgi:hypothetical protein
MLLSAMVFKIKIVAGTVFTKNTIEILGRNGQKDPRATGDRQVTDHQAFVHNVCKTRMANNNQSK